MFINETIADMTKVSRARIGINKLAIVSEMESTEEAIAKSDSVSEKMNEDGK